MNLCFTSGMDYNAAEVTKNLVQKVKVQLIIVQ